MVGHQAEEHGNAMSTEYDDDGQKSRQGTLLTGSAHIITAVIGAGVLSLSWAMAQLGLLLGTISLLTFAAVTWYTSSLLSDCYRTPDPVTGRRNYTYMDAVKATLGEYQTHFCGLVQHTNLVGTAIGYTITSAISMAAVKRSRCFHVNGHQDGCHTSNNPFILIFSIIQLVLCQLPNFHELSGLSIIAAVMSFAYSLIGIGLAIAKIAEDGVKPGISLTGTVVGVDVSATEKVWNCFQALGNIAFAYSFSVVLVAIQDTLKSTPPENQVMKKATAVATMVTTVFYLLCGICGYLAFGNHAPGNFLTGFGFYEPFWLVDVANFCIVIHLVGAYQVYCQPFFGFVETSTRMRWPHSKFVNKDIVFNIPHVGVYPLNFFRLVWRTMFVVVVTVVAMLFPFFNDVVGILGAITFWPMTVHFPTSMYMLQMKIPKFSRTWFHLKALSVVCFLVALISMVASFEGLIESVQNFKPFHSFS